MTEPVIVSDQHPATRLISVTTSHPVLADHQPMRTSRDKDTSWWREGMLLDDLLDAYVGWRE